MIKAVEINDENQLEIFKMCLDKCKECNSVVRVTQYIENKGQYNDIAIDDEHMWSNNTVRINGNYVYLTVVDKENTMKGRKFKRMFDIYLDRGHHNTLNNMPNDYIYSADLVATDEMGGYLFTISLVDPIFMCLIDDSVEFVFNLDSLRFGIEECNFVELANEIEYEAELEAMNNPYNDEIFEDDEFNENDTFISNDSFTTLD